MKKFLFLLSFTFTISIVTFGLDYWYLDITNEDFFTNQRPSSSVQRAYFFKDLRTLETATGFPHKENEDFYNRKRWDWGITWERRPGEKSGPVYEPNSIYSKIFRVMHNEGFSAAFVLTGTGISRNGSAYYGYTVFLISNGSEYYDSATLYDWPVRFP
jgi:hypothetical protein